MKRIFCLIVALVLVTAHHAAADTGAVITDFKLIPLQQGTNDIPHLAPDGRNGTIVKAWRENGNAQGYNLFLVMVEGKVAGVADGDVFTDFIADTPYTSENAVKSVRFARGRVGGQKAVLIVTARRDLEPDNALADPVKVVFDIYQLVANGQIGTTGDFFARISESRSEKSYCNSDLALFQKFGFPLPDPFEGSNQIDGCL